MGNDPAVPADEKPLVDTVAFVDVAALRALLGGVGGIDEDHGHAGPAGFVDDEVAELGEGPRVECDPLGLAEPYPLPDSLEFFQGDPG
ncbi:hypothetical protein HEB94_009469 [Actinopolymorpha pittospori]|uniref:Uncharacterized protein n=1 Tax=Actinopolymorpha pittospori TaxID=648752 RepID=A0A927N4P3_9ACTN|nr:hypothetical protein [Actinopolymorpha pittospori]MBE1612621.1 hypothetical protein [Actinopolymorpha pittospori]